MIELTERAFLQSPHTNRLQSAALYCLEGGGKRIRPLLTLLCGKVFGVEETVLLDPALALECVHIYSCIHDDLPCMDNDDYRRGMPTVHRAFDEATALLTGDFFLTLAFEILALAPHLSAEKKVALTGVLAAKAGASGMIGGQSCDLALTGQTLEEKDLLFMHAHKTGALFEASADFGALVGRSADQERSSIQHFALSLGIAYQIRDDLLDATGEVALLGKPIGSDSRNQKATSLSLYDFKETKRRAAVWYNQSLNALDRLDRDTNTLATFATSLIDRKF